MDTASTKAVEKFDETLNVSEGVATNTVKPDPSFKNTVQVDESPSKGSFEMMDKTEKPEEALEADHGEIAGQEGEEKTATDTTEVNSSTADDINSILVASDLKQEKVSEKVEGMNSYAASENAINNTKESPPNDVNKKNPTEVAKNGSSASSQEKLEESSNIIKESKDAETEADETKAAPATPIVSSSKKSRPSFKYDPNKITLRFLFANRDGLAVTIECNPSDTVGDVKGALISAWPEDAPPCATGENLRLVCMGKGFLMPDARTLEDIQLPIFKTHPTPINVSIKPTIESQGDTKEKKISSGLSAANSARNAQNTSNTPQANGGCPCSIL